MAGKATRQAFGESLARLGETHREIVVLDADLAKSTKSDLFAKKFPERFFEMGIQEANMIGVAAGMSFTGRLPFLCSFGAFITGRFDTIRLSVAYSGANVRLIGTHAGIGIGDDGHSQMGLEDVALMRTLPTMGVFQPMDGRETELVMDYLVKTWKGPAYLRLTRQNLPDLLPADAVAGYDPLKLLRVHASAHSRPRILFIGSGAGTAEAVSAAKKLDSQGMGGEVWNACSLKPFDSKTLATLVTQGNFTRVVTVEDHSVIGGLGSCVAESMAELPHGKAVPVTRIGVQDEFGESGEPIELYEKFGLSADRIVERVHGLEH